MAHLAYKAEIWVQIDIDSDTDLSEIVEKIKNNTNPYDAVSEVENSVPNTEFLLETEEYLSIEYNDGQSTIELYDNDGNLIYQNGSNEGKI